MLGQIDADTSVRSLSNSERNPLLSKIDPYFPSPRDLFPSGFLKGDKQLFTLFDFPKTEMSRVNQISSGIRRVNDRAGDKLWVIFFSLWKSGKGYERRLVKGRGVKIQSYQTPQRGSIRKRNRSLVQEGQSMGSENNQKIQ